MGVKTKAVFIGDFIYSKESMTFKTISGCHITSSLNDCIALLKVFS